jgi:restriction endonuclease S subunit
MLDSEFVGGELNAKIAKLEKRVSELEKLIQAMLKVIAFDREFLF